MMSKDKSFIVYLLQFLKNKYLITIFLFTIWILFIDEYNLIKKKSIIEKTNYLQKRKEYLINEIKIRVKKKYKITLEVEQRII